MIFRAQGKHRKMFSAENIFRENNFLENIFRQKLFYVEVNGAYIYIYIYIYICIQINAMVFFSVLLVLRGY
jgi:hypothetical protein